MPPFRHKRFRKLVRADRRRHRKLRAECLEPRLALAAEVEPNENLAQATVFGTADEILTGRLSNLGDRDYFQVVLAQGERLYATYDTVGTFDPEIIGGLELLDDAGRVLSTKVTDTGADMIAPKAGTYYVRTSPRNDYGEFTGTYAIGTTVDSFVGSIEAEPNDTTGTANSITQNTNFRGSLSSVSDLDYFTFSGFAGDVLSIDFANVPGDAPTVIVYRPDGSELARNDVGLGVQTSLSVSGTYRYAISAVHSTGTFTGQYVGRMNLVNAPVSITATTSFDTAVPITLGSLSVPVVGTLTDLNVARYLYFDVTTLNSSFVSIDSLPYNVKLSLFNERGQILDYRHGATLSTSAVDFAFTAGRYYVSIQAISETALGPFQLRVGRSTALSPQRDVPLYFLDFNGQQATHLGLTQVNSYPLPATQDFIEGRFESRYDSWDVDITQTIPPAGTEHVAQGYTEFGNTGVGGRGGGGLGTRRPSGDSYTDCATTSWTTIGYDCTNTMIHEFGHATGLLHARSVQGVMGYDNDDEIFPVGSGYLFPGTDSYVPSTYQNNSRDYLDWVLQAGRQIIEAEPNDAVAAAVGLDSYLNEMRIDFSNGASASTGTGTRPTDLRVANLNSDAWPDLVVANYIANTLTVHLGTGVGTFATAVSYSPGFTVDWFETVLAIGDLNSDSRDDVLIVGEGSSNNVAVYLANANGTLATPTYVTAGTFPGRIVLADLNNDTRLDLITGGSSQVGVHLGNGNGTFQPRATYNTGGSGGRDLLIANVNGDAHLDVITANYSGNNVSILRGNGNGTFQTQVSYAVGTSPMAVLLKELTGDSNLDLLTINYSSQTFSIIPGTGGGNFGAAMSQPGVPNMYSLKSADLNLDGKDEFIVSTQNGVRFFNQNTSGTLIEYYALQNTTNTNVALADLNADGKDDLLWANYWNNRVDLLLSKPNDVRNDRAVVFGRIDTPVDVDRYSFTAAAGQRFAIDIEAAEFQYPLDAVLSIFDSNGSLVVQNDDALDRDTGIPSVDPYLLHTFATAGTYQVRVASKLNTSGNYRLKLTPAEAIDDDGPKVIGTWSPANAAGKSRRQILFYLNDQLDPATLTAANVVVQGSTTGVRSGTSLFDPLESVLIWTADANLPIDTYTVTLAGGANGITDLKGNLLDGETDGSFAFPEVSGNDAPGGTFTFNFSVSTNDATAATITASYSRGVYNRGRFVLSGNDELSLEQVAGAQLTARGAGPDATFNTADDRILPLDVLQDSMNHRNAVYAYTRGIPDPDRYRLEGVIRDAAGLTINLNHEVNVAAEVPESALFTSAALTQTGLVGSYVNSSLRSYSTQDDWRTSQTIVGTRTDPTIDFASGDFGLRAEVGVTGGTDTNWDNFSTQWDGYLQVPAAGTRLLLRSNHGSRMWIDLNNDGIFNSSGPEFVSNFWGSTGSTTGTLSTAIAAAGAYRVRIQFEHQTGSSQQMFLEWLTPDLAGRTEGIGHGPSVVDSSVQPGSAKTAAGLDSISVRFSGAINPATLTTTNFRVRYSPDGRFYNGNDSYLTESDGLIAWNAAEHRATFQSSQPLAIGHYTLELNGDVGGIADNAGNLLDGEYLDSYIAGNTLPMQWQDSPSGDGTAGGDYVAAFSITNFTAAVTSTASVLEDSPAVLTFDFTRSGDVSTAETVNFAVGGTATFSSDYTQTGATTFSSTTGTVAFAAGATTATVTIHVTDDILFEADETVILTVTSGSTYLVGTPTSATSTILNDDSSAFLASSFGPTSTGVVVNFNRALNPAQLNLYDIQGDPYGAADLTLVGATNGNVRGSLVVDPNLQKVTFVATAGRLLPDTYTLTLRGAGNGFQDAGGMVLDGDVNGAAGGDYVQTFVVNTPAANAVTVSLDNFARGPQQSVNLPVHGTTGIPLSFSNAAAITTASFDLLYDTTLLTITGASVPPALVGANVSLDTSTPGVAKITFNSPTPLAAGTTPFVNLQATVPNNAPYRTKQVLDLANISLNAGGIPALDDDAVHVVAFFADVTGNGTYSAQDASLIARIGVGIGTGFEDYALLDPTIVGDITGNGAFSALDTSLMLQASVGVLIAEIPTPLPTVSLTQGGPDPKLSIPQNLFATAGGSLAIPVDIDSIVNLTGNGLTSADLVIYYDPMVLEVTSATLGRLIAQRGWLISSRIDPLAGRIDISLAGTRPLEGEFIGELVQLHATVKEDAPAGASAINLAATSRSRTTQLNEGFLTLIPAPTDAANDSIDGRVTITRTSSITPRPAVRQVNNHLIISGTAGNDHLIVAPYGNAVRVRRNHELLGDFVVIGGIAIDGLSGSDRISVIGLNQPTLIHFSDAVANDVVFGSENATVVEPNDGSSAAANLGALQLTVKDLALLQLLTELDDNAAGSQPAASRFRRR